MPAEILNPIQNIKKPPVFWFAGGGTGGHIYPGLSVAAALKQRRPEAQCVFFGTPRPIDAQVIPPEGHELVIQPVQPWPGMNLWRWPGFVAAWRDSLALCRARLGRDKPLTVLGLGGYAAAPAMKAAHNAGVPVAMHNPDARPGRANRTLAKYADRIFCQWQVSADLFPNRRVDVTGCPVRADLLTFTREQGLAKFGLDPAKRVLLFTGASQGAKNVNDALLKMQPLLHAYATTWQVVIITGPGKDEEFRQALSSLSREAELSADSTSALGSDPALGSAARLKEKNDSGCISVHVLPFTSEMGALLACTDLVVSRAGAGSCAEYTALGLPSLLIPYPYDATVHQQYNADVLVAAGAAIRVDDHKDPLGNAAALWPHLHVLLADEAQRQTMADNARTLGRPDAAEKIAEELLRMAGV